MTDDSHRVITTELQTDLPDVLIVDDDPDVRRAVEELLAEAGFTFVSACDGAQGLRFAHVWQPRVVILDINMPVLDGLQFLDRRRADVDLAGIAVIVLSSEPVDPVARQGAAAWLAKPVDGSLLLALISRLVCERPADRALEATR